MGEHSQRDPDLLRVDRPFVAAVSVLVTCATLTGAAAGMVSVAVFGMTGAISGAAVLMVIVILLIAGAVLHWRRVP